jgi:hypothetical protein
MSEPTGLLFAALALFTISALFRRVFLTSNATKTLDGNISDADPLAQLELLNIYSESQLRQKTASKQTSSLTLNLAPWQLEVALEVDRLIKTEAKQGEIHRAIDQRGPDASLDSFSRAVESEACFHPQ